MSTADAPGARLRGSTARTTVQRDLRIGTQYWLWRGELNIMGSPLNSLRLGVVEEKCVPSERFGCQVTFSSVEL